MPTRRLRLLSGMTLRDRLALGFLTIAILLAVPLAEALQALSQARRAAEDLRDNALTVSLVFAQARSAAGRLRQVEASILVTRGDSSSLGYLDAETSRLAALTDSLHRFGLDTLERTLRGAVRDIREYGPVERAARHDGHDDLADRVSDQHVQPAIAAIEEHIAAAEESMRERSRAQVEACL